MLKLDREKAMSLAAFLILMLACIAIPALSLKAQSDAAQELSDQQDLLARLVAAHQRSSIKPSAAPDGVAPDEAFLNASSAGLANAKFEAYLSQLASVQQASLVSSGAQQSNHAEGPEIIRIQATLDIRYEALQRMLYQLETGTPYVFVDSMKLQASNTRNEARDATMKVTLKLRALWHHGPA